MFVSLISNVSLVRVRDVISQMRACAVKQGRDPEETGTLCSRRALEGYSRSKFGALHVMQGFQVSKPRNLRNLTYRATDCIFAAQAS